MGEMGGSGGQYLLHDEVWTWNRMLARPKQVHHGESQLLSSSPDVSGPSLIQTLNASSMSSLRLSWHAGRRRWWRRPQSPVAASTWWSSRPRPSARSHRAWTQWFTKSSRLTGFVSNFVCVCVCFWQHHDTSMISYHSVVVHNSSSVSAPVGSQINPMWRSQRSQFSFWLCSSQSSMMWRFSVSASVVLWRKSLERLQLHFRRRAGEQQREGKGNFIWVHCSCWED